MYKRYYTYILSNKNDTTLYIGVTNDLERRVAEHRSGTIPGFTQKYNCHKLVYFEEYSDIDQAIAREKQLHVKGTGTWHVGATEGWYQYLSKRQYCYQPFILSCDTAIRECLIRIFAFLFGSLEIISYICQRNVWNRLPKVSIISIRFKTILLLTC